MFTVDSTPNRPADAARFLSLLDLTPILAVLAEFYSEQWRHRHPPEAMLRLVALYKLKRLRFLTELWRLLDDETLRLLGFRWRPSYKTVWHWLNRRLGFRRRLETIHAALMKTINEALEVQSNRNQAEKNTETPLAYFLCEKCEALWQAGR